MNNLRNTDILRKLYYDPKQGLFNATKLFQKVRELGIKLAEVRDFVKKQKTGQLYKGPVKKQYYPITAPENSFQIDLIFFPKTKQVNRGFDTIMTLVEITSRMGYCIPMKGKKTTQVIEAMKTFLEGGHAINNLMSDRGSEFISSSWKQLMKDHNISHFLADEGDHSKMGMIERFNRTIKGLISKYQTMYKTNKWIDILNDLVHNYNTTIHASTGYAPTNVKLKERALIRLKAAQETAQLDQKKNLNVGDKVRIQQTKTVFGKEGTKWSDEVYTIVEDNTKSFKLEGMHRRYKHHQLLKVDHPAEENPNQRQPQQIEMVQQPALPEPTRPVTRSIAPTKQAKKTTPPPQQPAKAVSKPQKKKAAKPNPTKVASQDDEEQFYIEKILAHKEAPDGTTQYKVRFVGYGPKDDLWFYDDDMLRTAPEMVAAYHEGLKK